MLLSHNPNRIIDISVCSKYTLPITSSFVDIVFVYPHPHSVAYIVPRISCNSFNIISQCCRQAWQCNRSTFQWLSFCQVYIFAYEPLWLILVGGGLTALSPLPYTSLISSLCKIGGEHVSSPPASDLYWLLTHPSLCFGHLCSHIWFYNHCLLPRSLNVVMSQAYRMKELPGSSGSNSELVS